MKIFKDIKNLQLFCLVGKEGVRMENQMLTDSPENMIGLLTPYPRRMGTYVPKIINNKSYQLDSIRFSGPASENVTALVLELCFRINPCNIYVVGYDGNAGIVTQNQMELFNKNEELFAISKDFKIKALTTTQYTDLEYSSIFSLI